jgi:hypothetical protein
VGSNAHRFAMPDLIVIQDAPQEMAQETKTIEAADFAAIFLAASDIEEIGQLQILQSELVRHPEKRRECEILQEMGWIYGKKGVEFISRTMLILRFIVKRQLWRYMLVRDGEEWMPEFQNQEAFMEHFLSGLRTIRDAYLYLAKADMLENLGFSLQEITTMLNDPSRLGEALSPMYFEQMPEGAKFAGFVSETIQNRVRDELGVAADEKIDPDVLAREYIQHVTESKEAANGISKRVMDIWTHKQYYYDDGAGGGKRLICRGWCGNDRYSHVAYLKDKDLHPEFVKFLESKRGVDTMKVIRGTRGRR